MKKVILSSLMAMFMFVGLTSMMSADPSESNQSQCQLDCANLTSPNSGIVFMTQGQCMSACQSCTNPSNSNGNFAVCQCNLLDALYGLESFDVNFGQCVKIIKAELSGS